MDWAINVGGLNRRQILARHHTPAKVATAII